MKREEVKAKIPGISEEQLQWLWEHNEAQDKILNDHETRISHLEHQ